MNCYNSYLKLVLFIYSNNYKLENIDIRDLIEKTKDFDEVECIVNNAILENNTNNISFDDNNEIIEEESDSNEESDINDDEYEDDEVKNYTEKLKEIEKSRKLSNEFLNDCIEKINNYKSIKNSLLSVNGLTDNNVGIKKKYKN